MYVILIEYADTPTRVIGPFDTEQMALTYAETHDLGGYSVIPLEPADDGDSL